MKKRWSHNISLALSVVFLITVLSAHTFASASSLSGSQSTVSQNNLTAIEPGRLIFQELVSGLSQPLLITNAEDGSGRLFVIERSGRIRIIQNGSLLDTPFLDITSVVKSTYGEQGLLALAFHPSYDTNGYFFVAYTAYIAEDDVGSDIILERYEVSSGDPNIADDTSGVTLLTISHPDQSTHHGGTLAFGTDGYLYWSVGDGGPGGDPSNNAQNLNSLLGKTLRIDADTAPYSIPPTNPFYSSTDPNIRKEIWSYGLRNPWRFSFDRMNGDLYLGDVGQGTYEEINFQAHSSAGGENYGWRVMEGSHCYNSSSGCNTSGKVLPVAEYNHSLGCSVTGGHVYRGSNYPSLAGYYIYGDFCSGRLFSLINPGTGWTSSLVLDTPYQISTFGEDEQGELYLADYATGKIYSIQYAAPAAESVGVFRPGNGLLYLKNTNTSGVADIAINYGNPGDYPVVGDWDGDGDDTIGIYRNGSFYLRNSNTVGVADLVFPFGQPGDQPIAGDWDGDGDDTIGVYRPSTGQFLLRNSNSAGSPTHAFYLGNVGDVGIAGDWDGDGSDTTGVFRPGNGVIYLKNTNVSGFADVELNYGIPGDKPVVGDWNDDGITTIGVYRNARFYLRNSNTVGIADIELNLGNPGDMPIAGDWDALP